VYVFYFFVVVAETVQIVVGAVVQNHQNVVEVVAETVQTVAKIVQMVVFVLQVESVSVVVIFASVATVFWFSVVFQPQLDVLLLNI